MITYLLDTNICIYIAKKHPASVSEHFSQLITGTVGMSIITYGELVFGAEKSHSPKRVLLLLEQLSELIPVCPLPIHAAKHYGEVRSKLEKQGKPIGANDLWIAAHALALNVTLVTNNAKEFLRVPHLKVENWI